MNPNHKKITESVKAISMALTPSYGSLSPDEVKAVNVELLSPYFHNSNIVDEMAVTWLAPLVVNICKVTDDPWSKAVFEQVLQAYREATAVNKHGALSACAEWESRIAHATSEFWSAIHLGRDLDDLAIEEFKFEAFRLIGVLIEACLQPQLKCLLSQVRIRRAKPQSFQQIDSLELGNVIEELLTTAGHGDAYSPLPWDIRLSQWRNMAQHHKTSVREGKIVGYYGRPPNEIRVELERAELFRAVVKINSVFEAIKTARTIIVFDNIEDFRALLPERPFARDEVKLLNLATMLATQGFDLVDFGSTGGHTDAIVQDVTDIDEEKRRIHASQFVYPVWMHFPNELVSVEYRNKYGDKKLVAMVKALDCEEIASGLIPPSELANRVELKLVMPDNSILVVAPSHGLLEA